MEPSLSQKFTNETNKLDEGELLAEMKQFGTQYTSFIFLPKIIKKRNVEIVPEFGGWLIYCKGTYR